MILNARAFNLVLIGLLLCGLIWSVALKSVGHTADDPTPSASPREPQDRSHGEVIVTARSPVERHDQTRSASKPKGLMTAREAIEARYGASARQVLEKLDEEDLEGFMVDPALAVDRFMELLDPLSGSQAAFSYMGLVAWPGMSLQDPPIVPLGNFAELGWQNIPVPRVKLEHLEEAYVFAQAESLAATFNADLDELAREYVGRYYEILSGCVRSGQFEQHPSLLPDPSPAEWGKGLPKAHYSVGGWSMKVTLEPSDWEALHELQTRIQETREAREKYLAVKLQDL